ncbi:MAG: hypothetical protein CL677_09715 [Bdellovibrionaceae bacterium]|nr:hypothetical protein [Pseudobdellovibrionaceae bacterium]
MIRFGRSFFLLLLLSVQLVAGATLAQDRWDVPFSDNKVFYLAHSLGIASGRLNHFEVQEIDRILVHNFNHPEDKISVRGATLRKKWRELTYVAQTLVVLRGMHHYFPVGYEVESRHKKLNGYFDFASGTPELRQLVSKHMGGGKVELEEDNFFRFRDGRGKPWDILSEFVFHNENFPSGWELVSPPFRHRDDLRFFTQLLLELTKNPFGYTDTKNTDQTTGVHQNFDLSPAGDYSEKIEVLTFSNFIVLLEQFGPTLFDLFKIQRGGGFGNIYYRPLIIDHFDFLKSLSLVTEKNATWAHVNQLYETAAPLEREIQISLNRYMWEM